jgi:hypothetical protein
VGFGCVLFIGWVLLIPYVCASDFKEDLFQIYFDDIFGLEIVIHHYTQFLFWQNEYTIIIYYAFIFINIICFSTV